MIGFSALLAAPFAAAMLAGSSAQMDTTPAAVTDRPPEDEIIYFVLPDRFENGDTDNDRGGIRGDRLKHGFDPTHKGFYQGGDLAGLTARLDYIQSLGATAIWLSPIFENKPVQGRGEYVSAGYHGYWITDFLNVDPHLGTREEFKALVDAAHARGMKVYMDIITNHTADVIQYQECHGRNALPELKESGECPYRSKGDYPYTTIGGPDGKPVNQGFLGDDPAHLTTENFSKLTNPNYAYTPFVPRAERRVKNPAWLNDVRYYHNRGNTRFEGENSRMGDFVGLDDLMTEDPFVVQGMIDIYKQWITDFRVDGYRIDTARHVNPEFWQIFAPAILDHAAAEGIPNFHMFGEVYEFEPGQLAKFTTEDGFPAILDFAFQGRVRSMVAEDKPARDLDRLFTTDAVYAKGFETAKQLPTFLGNHDMGRFSGFIREANPEISDEELTARIILGHAILMVSRGVPTIYYGDEQGFVSDGHDQDARETLFPSVTDVYTDNDLAGTDATVADENFDRSHPIYTAISELAAMRQSEPALRRGAQMVRHSDLEGGVIVLSRMDPDGSGEIIGAFNAENEARTIRFPVDGRSGAWQGLHGDCLNESPAPGMYEVTLPATGFVICKTEFQTQ
ncbi:alpha-amylase family glycosyl hydrolase [Parvularcula marina]|uniref:alpha-amylase family glycosyl hydrolase n=1 Tax=Parvularcula marina TaxID=2292771 RepID=UPI0035114F87